MSTDESHDVKIVMHPSDKDQGIQSGFQLAPPSASPFFSHTQHRYNSPKTRAPLSREARSRAVTD